MTYRIAVGGIEHESTSFIPAPTPVEEFQRQTVRGDALAKLGHANTIVDGFVRGVCDHGMKLVPLLWVKGISGGLPTLATYTMLKNDLLERLRDALPVDGVLLSLHGSFAAVGIDDADGDILQSVRELVGSGCPVIAVHAFHSNISRQMVDAADVLVIERTYPHIDMAEQALHAVALMHRILDGDVQPTMAYRPLPLLWAAPTMITAHRPMSDAIAQLQALDREPRVLSASLGVGYQWVDSPLVGASVVVITDDDPSAAQSYADQLGHWIWARRAQWQRESLSPERALEQGELAGQYPIVLADQSDNTGGGAPGDSTEILQLFVERDLESAAVLYVVDGEVAEAASFAGVGQVIDVEVGGKSDPRLGPPVPMRAEVVAVSDGNFTYDGPMWAGVEGFMGDSAWIRQRGVNVVVITERQQPIDLAFARSLGLDCRTMKTISVKSTGHFRSGFEPIAGSIYNVDTAGQLSQDFANLPYTRLGRPVYPLDVEAPLGW